MDNDIEKMYKAFNYPSSVPKLLKIVKSNGINATSNDMQIFLNKRVAVQQTKIIKLLLRHQIDIYVSLKYANQNKGYWYILAIMGVFSSLNGRHGHIQ